MWWAIDMMSKTLLIDEKSSQLMTGRKIDFSDHILFGLDYSQGDMKRKF